MPQTHFRSAFVPTATFALIAFALIRLAPAFGQPGRDAIRYLDQGTAWTAAARAQFYSQDQGSQLIPLAWLRALKQPDGRPFMDAALGRYGYLPNPDLTNPAGLPVGFTRADSAQGAMVGMTCSACHTRQIHVGPMAYRIDGGPAIADFQSFLVDLDAAVHAALANDAAFARFSEDVGAADTTSAGTLRADVMLWWTRFHALVSRAVPTDKPWGPARLDAITMIYDRLDGLDLGPSPTFLIPENIARADAPARYPFLWNATRQDFTQWGGFSENGNDMLGVARSLGEVYGVFAMFHPQAVTESTAPLDRTYLATNSTNFAGLATIEGLLHRLGPPKWPWPVDTALAAKGETIFNRPTAEGGCVACHGIAKGLPRPPNLETWRTPTADVGTDVHQWQIITQSARPGVLTGASIPGVMAPLQKTDLALNVLKLAVVGTIAEYQAVADGRMSDAPSAMPTPMPRSQMDGSYKVKDVPPPPAAPATPKPVYESRVLQGIWAAAPYLHNGSVPTLVELLKPASRRVTAFKVGPSYDIVHVGLAVHQSAFDFTLHTTGCDDRTSGNSNCGHEYGTSLPDDDKRALLEYLKTL